MKRLFLLFLLPLAGCRQNEAPPAPPAPTAVPRPGMESRLMQVFPGARVKKLVATEEGEFYEAARGGKIIGRAALFPMRDADNKELEVLLVNTPEGKIERIAAGVPGSGGLTPNAAELNEFLQQFVGKTEVGLTKYQLRRGMKEPTGKNIVEALRRALIHLRNAAQSATGTKPPT